MKRHWKKVLEFGNTSISGDVEQWELWYIVSRNVNQYNHFGEPYGNNCKSARWARRAWLTSYTLEGVECP